MALAPRLSSRFTKLLVAGGIVALSALTILEGSLSTRSLSQSSFFQQYLVQQAGSFFSLQTDSNKGDEPRIVDKPLNIVLLYADDWRHDALGIAGTLPVETPFLDWLATNKGIRFTHNCVTTSVCWISRVTMIMGQYLSRHGGSRVMDNSWYKNFNTSWPARLHAAGYYLAFIGKWHTVGFEQIENYWDFSTIYYGRHFFPGNPRQQHVTERNEQDAIKTLRTRPKDKPFQMTVSFFAPHAEDDNPDQFLPQEKSMSLYPNITLRPSVNMSESYSRMPPFFSEENIARIRYHARFDEPTKYNKMLKNYFRLITEVDSVCQSIWNELEAQGILNETMVIFTTDNGFYHGEHGLAGKWYPHEESIRTPLLVWDPRMPPNKEGTTEDAFTLNVDLAQTILGAANVYAPVVMQGQDMSDLYLKGQAGKSNWRKEFLYEYPNIFDKSMIPGSTALVRKGSKYIQWFDWATEQLFNLTNDPIEEKDEINNPLYADMVKDMRERHNFLKEWVK